MFASKTLRTSNFFLSLEVAHSKHGISLCQWKYVLELMVDTGLLGCKPTTTPMDNSLKLSQVGGDPLLDSSSYKWLIGRLIYLTTTRLDLSFLSTK